MIARLKTAVRRLLGIKPPEPASADREIRCFVAALSHLALFARVGSQIVRSSTDGRP